MEDKNFRGHAAMLVANVVFGLNVPIAKTVLGSGLVSPYSLTLFRMGGAAVLFWILSFFTRREKVAPKDLMLLFFASLFSIQLNQTSFLIGLSMTSPIDASIVASIVPILTMLIAALYLKEPITWKKAIGVAIGASGALLLVLSNASVTHTQSNMTGDLICLLGALSFAIYLTVFKRLISRYSPVTLMKWMFLYAALCSLPFCGGDVARIDFSLFTPELWAGVLYVVCAATFFAYLLIPIGQQNLRPTVVSMYNYLQPFIASVVAVLIGLDRFGFVKGFAALLVCLGVYVVTQSKSRAQMEAEKRARAEQEAMASKGELKKG